MDSVKPGRKMPRKPWRARADEWVMVVELEKIRAPR
jgi:uncharacterized cupin superfamily protein